MLATDDPFGSADKDFSDFADPFGGSGDADPFGSPSGVSSPSGSKLSPPIPPVIDEIQTFNQTVSNHPVVYFISNHFPLFFK